MFLIKSIFLFVQNFLASGFLLFVISVSTLSCGLHIGETKVSQKTKGFSVGCLNKIDKKIQLYIQGQLKETEINKIAYCAKTILMIFKERVHGRNKEEFTPQELRKFIQDVFLQDQIVRDEFLTQLIKLKMVMIGGAKDKLTVLDINRFISFVDIVKSEVVFFQPYIQAFYSLGSKTKLNEIERLDIIEQDLQKSINRISGFFTKFSQVYTFLDIKSLIKEVLFHSENHISNLDQKVEAFASFKQFVVGGSDSFIQPHEWKDLLIAVSYLVSINVKYTILKNQNSIFTPEGMQHIFVIYKSVIKFLFLAVKNHTQEVILEKDFIHLSSRLQEAGIIPSWITDKSIHSLLTIIFGKIFNIDKKKYGIIELSIPQIQKIQQTLTPWNNVQVFLDKFFHSEQGNTITTDIKKRYRNLFHHKKFVQEYNIVKQLLLFKPFYNKGKKVTVSRSVYLSLKSPYKYQYKNLTMYNFYYLLSTMLRLGYEEHYVPEQGLTSQQLGQFFDDFYVIQKDFSWVQEKKQILALGEAEFIAGNMLTPSALGFNHDLSKPEYINSNEISEYISYAVSFGFSVKELETHLLLVCRNNLNSKYHQYDIDCVRVHLLPILNKIMNNMPDMRQALKQLNKKQKQNWTESLIHISFQTQKQYQKAMFLERKNLTNIIMALYFVETTINRFDLNHNLTLNNEEIWKAFSIFEGYLSRTISTLHCETLNDIVPSLYAYAIHHGYLPTNTEGEIITGVITWIKIRLHEILKQTVNYDMWILSLDRAKLTYVYSALIKGFLLKKEDAKIQNCSL